MSPSGPSPWGTSLPSRDPEAVEGQDARCASSKQRPIDLDNQTATSHSLNDTPLRFINASHPSEVKSLQNRRLIKQHAMLDAQQRRREASAANAARKRALKAAQATSTSIAPRQLLPKTSGSSHGLKSQVEPALKMESKSPNDEKKPLDPHGHTAEEVSSANEVQITASISRYAGWSSADPFGALPQFSNPHIRVEKLQYLNMAFFPTLQRSQQYVNALISSPLVLLSDAHPGMILQDALDESPMGGSSSLSAKSEIYNMINHRLRSSDVAVQSGRDVVAGIFNLIWLEMSYGNLHIIQTHIQGLRRVFQQLGGISKTGFDRNLMIMSVYQGLETAIYFEIPAPVTDIRLGQALQKEHGKNAQIGARWESPINSNDFSSARLSSLCSNDTLTILEQVRRLTVRYLEYRHSGHDTASFSRESHTVYRSLLGLNPASTPLLPTTKNWVYECVRIASIIWATAIIEDLPISIALPVAAVRMPGTTQPIQSLVHALKKTNTQHCWAELIGSFMWVCKVGCVAAPTGSVPFKWFYLEVARATVLALRSRQSADVLKGSETILLLQAALRNASNGGQAAARGYG